MEEKKMVTPSKPVVAGTDDEVNVLSIFYRFFKKISIVGAVYLVGYMQWSVAWLIGPVVMSVLRDQWRKQNEYRRSLAKAAALSSEKDVVLARIDDLPAWVFFPDVERAEWLNRILLQVWPNVNSYARTLLKETIEPAVAENLANYKLSGFRFERMILGTIAPRIGGVKVYDKNLSRNEIIMDVDLFYAGDCDISFVLGGIKGGIKDLQIHGMVRVVMKPLITKIPLVGGLQIFFLNNPSIDFNLVGAADVLDLPGFSDILRRCIVEQVAAMMVLPNKLPIKLSDEIPTVDLRMPEPEGVLRIHLVQAKNLMKKDISVLGKGKSDPYAVLTVGAQQWKTKHIDNDVNPRWDFWCEARIMQTLGQALELEVFDKDEGNDDDKLGRCSLDISQVVRFGRMDTVRRFFFILRVASHLSIFDSINETLEKICMQNLEHLQKEMWQTLQQAKHGQVHLRLSWHRLSPDIADLKPALLETQLIKFAELSSAVLSVYIDSCKKLPNARSQSRPDPYLTVTVGKKTENSAVQMRTDSPVYEIGYSFLVQNPDIDTLEIKVVDQKTGNPLGQLSYAIAALLKQPDLTVITQPLMLHKSGPESKIIMSLCLKILKEAIREDEIEDENAVEKPPSVETPPVVAPPPVSSDSADASAPATTELNDTEPKSVSDADPDDVSTSSVPLEQLIKETDMPLAETLPSSAPDTPKLVHRTSSLTTNIPLKDPSNVPDPYVKLYLLPGRSKDSKRKTGVVRDSCMPEYDEQFEWAIALAELHSRQLEVTVATHKGFLAGSPIIGQVIVQLNQYDFREAKTLWFDLLPETTRD